MVLRLAWRSLWRNRRRTAITLASIALGLAIAVFFVAIAEGVYEQLIRDATRMYSGHVTLEHPDYRDAPSPDLWIRMPEAKRRAIEALPGVNRTKGLVLGQGMAKSASGAVGISLMGVEPDAERAASPLANRVVSGRFLEEGDGALVLLGVGLARQLDLEVGKKLVLAANDAAGTLVEDLCRVAGIFESGVEEIDGYVVLAPLAFTRDFYGLPPDGITQLGLVLERPGARPAVLRALHAGTAGYGVAVRRWEEVLTGLAAYVKMDRTSNLFMQALLLAIVLFTIFNTLLMSVLERRREFAVLLALGTPIRTLRLQVLLETALLGLLGCLLGLIIGGVAGWIVQVHGWDLRSLYPEGVTVSGLAVDPVLHARVTPLILFGLGGVVYAATLLMGLVPMRHAGRVPVVATLRQGGMP